MEKDYEKMYYNSVKSNEHTKVIQQWRTKNISLIGFLRKIKNKKETKILELGSGRGFMVKYLNEIGFNVIGSDFNKYNLKLSKEINNLSMKHLDANKIDLDNKSFDIVIAVELIEHLKEIEENIKEVSRILKTNGLYCITTPNLHLEKMYKLLTGKTIDEFHISVQTHRSLKKILKKNGFSVKFIRMTKFTDSQIDKLGKFHKFIPIAFLPKILQPTIVCIASKLKSVENNH